MAKLTLLQAMNEVLKRCGESVITGTASLAVFPQVVFDALNRSLVEICQDTNLKPLETLGTLALQSGIDYYNPPSDFNTLAYSSIQNPNTDNSNTNINLLTPDEFDQFFPIARREGRSGYPVAMTYQFSQFWLDCKPTSSENGKSINFRYFKVPDLFVQGADSGTCYIPMTYDTTLLCDYATWLAMEYLDHPKANYYYVKVFGDQNNRAPEGALSKFKRAYGAPMTKPRVTFNF